MARRTCRLCLVEQDAEQDYYKTPAGNPRQVCKSCVKARTNAYYHQKRSEPELQSSWYKAMLRRRYGLDDGAYDRMVEAQDGRCAICGEEPSVYRDDSLLRFHVDHCHRTDTVRGLLCRSCNLGLGNFMDDPARLERAIEYLRQPPGVPRVRVRRLRRKIPKHPK